MFRIPELVDGPTAGQEIDHCPEGGHGGDEDDGPEEDLVDALAVHNAHEKEAEGDAREGAGC